MHRRPHGVASDALNAAAAMLSPGLEQQDDSKRTATAGRRPRGPAKARPAKPAKPTKPRPARRRSSSVSSSASQQQSRRYAEIGNWKNNNNRWVTERPGRPVSSPPRGMTCSAAGLSAVVTHGPPLCGAEGPRQG